MKSYDDSIATWCDDRMEEIRRAARTPKEELPSLDRIVSEHHYRFGDISQWPDDCCFIRSLNGPVSGTKEHCYLGSLAACRDLSQDGAAGKIHCVVSFCAKEMRRIRGQPEMGWNTFFRQLGIHWICLDLVDPKTKRPGVDPFCEIMGKDYLSAWTEMCVALAKHMEGKQGGPEHGILFHCFAGINRSSAGLCAWLIFRGKVSGNESIESLLTVRPSLNQWQNRPHVLWALRVWELDQERIFRPQILARVSEAKTG